MNRLHERKHYAIDVSEKPLNKKALELLLEENWLSEEAGTKGLLFSEITLQKYLNEEYHHGKKILTSETDSLISKSSGERKKALLDYQLSQNPDFLILDNPFETLDASKVSWFKKELELLSKSTTLIQLYKRKEDLLPFIDCALIYEESRFKKVDIDISEESTESTLKTIDALPQVLNHFSNIPESLIRFDSVSVSFDEKVILKDITWEVKKGEFWHLKGPNGAGKTTLLSMITGDSTKGYGKELYIFGNKKGSGESVWDIKQKIGFFTTVMTERFDGMHTVLEMILSGLYDSVGLYHKPTTLQISVAEEWLMFIGLQNLRGSAFRSLEEVEKRLVLIARALIKQPPVLILDEPTSALNAKGAALLVAVINSIVIKGQIAVIYVSHRVEKGLQIQKTLELTPSNKGSVGEIKDNC